MKKFSVLAVATAVMLTLNACSGGGVELVDKLSTASRSPSYVVFTGDNERSELRVMLFCSPHCSSRT